MRWGTFYGIGVGPGHPEWITVQGARVLGACRHVFVPRSSDAADSIALEIAKNYLSPEAEVHELTFPMTSDDRILRESWTAAARQVLEPLAAGQDACFLTLGDALLYSTYIFLLESLLAIEPGLPVVTVPGITAASAAAALTNTPIGRKKQIVTIVPASDDWAQLEAALDRGGIVVLMKIGRRLEQVLGLLAARGLTGRAVFVSRAGMPNQRVETNVARLRGEPDVAGYLSIMIISAGD